MKHTEIQRNSKKIIYWDISLSNQRWKSRDSQEDLNQTKPYSEWNADVCFDLWLDYILGFTQISWLSLNLEKSSILPTSKDLPFTKVTSNSSWEPLPLTTAKWCGWRAKSSNPYSKWNKWLRKYLSTAKIQQKNCLFLHSIAAKPPVGLCCHAIRSNNKQQTTIGFFKKQTGKFWWILAVKIHSPSGATLFPAAAYVLA